MEEGSGSEDENFENFGQHPTQNQQQNQFQKFDPESSDEDVPQYPIKKNQMIKN